MGPEKCPFCGQEIDADSVKCFFCGAELNEESVEKQLEQLESQNGKKTVRKVRLSPVLLLIIILILICITVYPWSAGTRPSINQGGPSYDSNIRLSAKVALTGTRFTISNDDSFDWTNVELNIISENIDNSFSLQIPKIPAGQTHIARAAEFIAKDGICFDPYTMQTDRFSIWCEIPNGESGTYFAALK